MAAAFILAIPAPASAQAPPPPGGLDLSPILQIVCDLTGLLCPPAPAPAPVPAPAEPPPGPQPGPLPAPVLDQGAGDLTAAPPASPSGEVSEIPAVPAAGPEGEAAAPPGQPAGPPPEAPERGARVRRAESVVHAEPIPLPRPEEVDLSPRTVAIAAGVSLLGLILIGFPAELFNRALRNNYDRLRRLFRWRAPVPSGGTPQQMAALVGSALVAGALATISRVRNWDPGAALVIAFAVGGAFLVTVAVHEVTAAAAGDSLGLPRRVFRSYPAGLPVLAFFVAISTLGQLEPPYLYGHLAGSRQEARVDQRAEANQLACASGALLVLAILCWAFRSLVTSSPWTDVLAAITLVSVNRLVFSLIPIQLLEGHVIFRNRPGVWAGLYGASLLAFLLLVLLPATESASSREVGAAAVPFAIFTAISVGLWLRFGRRGTLTSPA